MDGELDSGLLGIALSDSEDAGSEAAADQAAAAAATPREGRITQSEDAFRRVRNEYQPKVEDGEIYKRVRLPLNAKVTKPEAQELLHAAEELYFLRRYEEATVFIQRVLCDEGNPVGLDEDTVNLLKYYEVKCLRRMNANPSA